LGFNIKYILLGGSKGSEDDVNLMRSNLKCCRILEIYGASEVAGPTFI